MNKIRWSTLCLMLLAPRTGIGQDTIPTGDWPQWRGPNRDGHAVGARIPLHWPRTGFMLLWQARVGSGYSSPVIAAGRVYTMGRLGQEEVVFCLDDRTGREVWKHTYAAPYEVNKIAARHGPGPKSTITATAAGRIYTLGISGIMHCLNAADGKVIWRRDFERDFQAPPVEYGTAASPLVVDDLVVVPVGAPDGAVMALSTKDGKAVWKAVKDGACYASPIVADLAGMRQIIAGTQKSYVGIAATEGRVLWRYPFETAYDQNIVTPCVWGQIVLISGLDRGTTALKPTQTDGKTGVRKLWRNPDLRMYLSSPVVHQDHLYGIDRTGKLMCLDLKQAGRSLWEGGDFGQYASLVLTGNHLLILDHTGVLTLVEASPKRFRRLARARVSGSQTWAHLAVVGSRIYVRNRTKLICYDMSKANR